ncbi:ribosome small subunit-dependent GTPase A [Alloiococcus sp. CFN-8]|uniref:ribosome small subunit-dependent GTPase A n=1 Tax=Alloiococcus sp. CFN-8 TaxID=3416081 RepID=UPI003CF30263
MITNNNYYKQNTNLLNYGFDEKLLSSDYGSLTLGRITAVHRGSYELVSSLGFTNGILKSSIYYNNDLIELYPTVGDFVLFQYNPYGDSVITETLPRKSCFTRRDPDKGRGEQAIASNFDYVFIVTSLNHDFNPKRLERYVTEAWQSGGNPIIVLTKADLKPSFQEEIDAAAYAAPDVPLYAVSTLTGHGLEELSTLLRPGITIVLLGSSGVGKSSLVNAIAGEELMKVNLIREDDSKGRHTTTHRQLISLSTGLVVIDTPGMRSLGMWDVSEGLGETFVEIEELIALCKFSDCTHTNEPGCAVNDALSSGKLSEDRYQSYLKLKKEARFIAHKENKQKRKLKDSNKKRKFK